MTLTALTRSAIRTTFNWDLHFLSKDDVDLASAATRIWAEQRDIELIWPSTPTPDITENFEERVRSGLTLISTEARTVAELLQSRPESIRSDADIGAFREASKALERLWTKLAKLTARQSGVTSPTNSIPAAISIALGEAEQALPVLASGIIEPFGFIQRLRPKHGGGANQADVQHLSSRIARRWAQHRKHYFIKTNRTVDIRESLSKMCADQGRDRTACKLWLIEQVLQQEVGLLERPRHVRVGQQWMKREQPRGDALRSRVWLEDECPYLLWNWYGNQVIRRAEELVAFLYPPAGVEPSQENGGRIEAALSAAVMTQTAEEVLMEMRLRLTNWSATAGLSQREREVSLGLALGETGVEIAKRLGISPNTVYTYRLRAERKLRKEGFR